MEAAKAMEMPAARALGVSKGQSHSAGEGERAGEEETQVWSILLPPTAYDITILQASLSLKIISWGNIIELKVKIQHFMAVYTILFGLTLTALTSSPTMLCLTSFFFFFLQFLGPLPRHMEVPRLGV